MFAMGKKQKINLKMFLGLFIICSLYLSVYSVKGITKEIAVEESPQGLWPKNQPRFVPTVAENKANTLEASEGTNEEKAFEVATPAEIATANNRANEAVGFNPLLNVKRVATWAEFLDAYKDATVTKIVLENDIQKNDTASMNTADKRRRTSLEIDGQGHILNLNFSSLEINTPTDGIGFFHIHDLTAQQKSNNTGVGVGYWAFVNGSNFANYVEGWRFRTGNIMTTSENGTRIGRFVRGYQSEIQLYGKLELSTTEENFYAGSMKIENKTYWKGTVTAINHGVVWFVENSTRTNATGKSMEVTIGANCKVLLKNETNGNSYPALYQWYQAITVGENSTYSANMQGNAVRFDYQNSSLTVKADAVVNLLSRGTGAVVQFSANNTSFKVEPGGSVYIVGNTTGGVVTLNGGSSRLFELEEPESYDIRNRNDSGTAFNMSGSGNTLTINKTDIDLWNVGKNILGPSQETYALVEKFQYVGNGAVTTTEPGLAAFNRTNYRRITGMNNLPEVEWYPVTNADKSYKARVLLGMTPSDEFDEEGNVILIPVYASKNQGIVNFTEDTGAKYSAATNEEGYGVVTSDDYYKTGKKIVAEAIRGPWTSAETKETTVIDITPPEPATVDNEERVSPISTKLSGTGEANALVSFTLNDVTQPALNTIVNAEGKWTVTIPDSLLKQDDVIQIFLCDQAGKTEIADRPATNGEIGNQNPKNDLIYHDATFKAAKKVMVKGIISLASVPQTIQFHTLSIVDYQKTVSADKSNLDSELIVEDTRGARDKWDLTAEILQEMTNGNDQLVGALKYVYKGKKLTLTNIPQTIYENKANDTATHYNISDSWGEKPADEGMKFQYEGERIPKTDGNYTGVIKWTLRDTIE